MKAIYLTLITGLLYILRKENKDMALTKEKLEKLVALAKEMAAEKDEAVAANEATQAEMETLKPQLEEYKASHEMVNDSALEAQIDELLAEDEEVEVEPEVTPDAPADPSAPTV